MKRALGWGVGIFLTVCCLGLCLPGWWLFLEVPLVLLFGWVWFLGRVGAEMRFDWAGTLTAVICLVLLAIGIQLFGSWLASHRREQAATLDAAPVRWRWRWTLGLLSVIVLMFVAGVSAVGITHQSVWLASSPEPLVQGYSSTWFETMNNLKQQGIAAHAHQDVYKTLPAGATFDSRGNALHGWQTAMLPFVEQDNLYKQIDQKLPWNHPKNAAHFKVNVWVYADVYGSASKDADGFELSGFASNVRVIGGNVSMTLKDITDGTSHTLLIGQVAQHHMPWGYPLNWRDPALGINKSPDGFGSPSKRGALFVFADGHVKSLNENTSPDVLRALSTPRGGEQIDGID